MAVDVFTVPVFFITFRETLETSIVVAVLLTFLKQMLDGPDGDAVVYKKLVRQVGQYANYSIEGTNLFTFRSG
jgi:high-affinity iron transporter